MISNKVSSLIYINIAEVTDLFPQFSEIDTAAGIKGDSKNYFINGGHTIHIETLKNTVFSIEIDIVKYNAKNLDYFVDIYINYQNKQLKYLKKVMFNDWYEKGWFNVYIFENNNEKIVKNKITQKEGQIKFEIETTTNNLDLVLAGDKNQ